MSDILRKVTAAAIAASLTAVPTGAIAASPAAPTAAPAASSTSANPWVALSAMTSTSSSATAALQDDDGPGFPPIAPLIVILGTIALAVYILTKDDDGDDLGLPLSPD